MRSREACEDFVNRVNKQLKLGTSRWTAVGDIASETGRARSTGYDIIRDAQHYGFGLTRPPSSGHIKRTPSIVCRPAEIDHRGDILKLKKQIAEIERHNLEVAEVRKEIFRLAETPASSPDWTLDAPAKRQSGVIGIPVAIWSDWHLGEVITPSEVNNVNAFNLKIAEQRIKRLVDRTLDVCFNHMVSPKYPGLVINLLGDIVSGNIHHELELTNEEPLFPVILKATDYIIASLQTLAKHFPAVHVVCTPGNHGRQTHKPEFKRYTVRNADWLIATLAERAIGADSSARERQGRDDRPLRFRDGSHTHHQDARPGSQEIRAAP